MNWGNVLLYIFHFGSSTFLFVLLFVFDHGPGYTGIMPSLMPLGVPGSPLIGIFHSTNSQVSHSRQEAKAWVIAGRSLPLLITIKSRIACLLPTSYARCLANTRTSINVGVGRLNSALQGDMQAGYHSNGRCDGLDSGGVMIEGFENARRMEILLRILPCALFGIFLLRTRR